MKNKMKLFILTGAVFVTIIGCSKKEDGFENENGKDVVPISEEYTSVSLENDVEESSEEIYNSEEAVETESNNKNSEITQSHAKDEKVREAQEAYMSTLHSQKGESVVTRSEGDTISYTEIVRTEEEGKVDFYYYAFLNTEDEYERTLKSFMEEDDAIILEQNKDALYIKMQRKNGMSTYFENVEQAAIRGNELEIYVE